MDMRFRPSFYTFLFAWVLGSVLLLPTVGCREDRTLVKQLQKETEDIHDEAMKGLATMNRLNRQLKSQLSTLDSLSPRRDTIHAVLSQMTRADEGMQQWMMQYQLPDKMAAQAAAEYLQGQKQAIEANKRDIEAAIGAAERLAR